MIKQKSVTLCREEEVAEKSALDAGGGGAAAGGDGDEVPVKISGCHHLRTAGETTETGVYSLASGKELNEAGRDYNTRLCDMTTDGGGWTVIFVFRK